MSETDPDTETETDHDSPLPASDDWLGSDEVRSILQEALDRKDYQIYRVLNEEGRMSDTEIGERVGLSRTAVRRRREQLQENGVLDVLAVLILQNADLAYADVRVSLSTDPTAEEIETFVRGLLEEELIYEVDEYMGDSDLLVRVWHASLQELKRYTNRTLQNERAVDSYDIDPVIKTRKAWHKVLD